MQLDEEGDFLFQTTLLRPSLINPVRLETAQHMFFIGSVHIYANREILYRLSLYDLMML